LFSTKGWDECSLRRKVRSQLATNPVHTRSIVNPECGKHRYTPNDHRLASICLIVHKRAGQGARATTNLLVLRKPAGDRMVAGIIHPAVKGHTKKMGLLPRHRHRLPLLVGNQTRRAELPRTASPVRDRHGSMRCASIDRYLRGYAADLPGYGRRAHLAGLANGPANGPDTRQRPRTHEGPGQETIPGLGLRVWSG
jgi:hypothetical protein